MLKRLQGLVRPAPPPAPPASAPPAPADAARAAQARLAEAQAVVRHELARGAKPADHPRPGGASASVSVIVPSITPDKFARVSASFHAALAGFDHEIVGIHDARSMCEACNRGARQSRGDILVFAHDDIEIASPDFAARLLDRMGTHDVLGIAGTSRVVGPAWAAAGAPHLHGQVGYRAGESRIEVVMFGLSEPVRADAQALDGCFMAARRHVIEEVPFDEARFDGWHLYDVDFTLSAWLAGFGVAVCEDILVIHQSRGHYDAAWQRAAERFAAKHGAALPPTQARAPVPVQGLVIESIDEWRLVTERLTRSGEG